MSAAVPTEVAAAESPRLLADVEALHQEEPGEREPALERLEAVLGRDFADRLVAALSSHPSAPERQ